MLYLAVDRQERYSRVIREAAETLGSEELFASFLGVSPEQLGRWLSGAESAPLEVFLAGLDVVARGPFARKRQIRIAVFDPSRQQQKQ